MPTAEASRAVNLGGRILQSQPILSKRRVQVSLPTPPPEHLSQSTVMISSLPSIATTVDGITRQFYSSRTLRLPVRRLSLPS